MNGVMPYVYEKGPVWKHFDDLFAAPTLGGLGKADRLTLLNNLRRQPPNSAPPEPTDGPLRPGTEAGRWEDHFIAASVGAGPPLSTLLPPVLEQHLRDDWFRAIADEANEQGWLRWIGAPAETISRGFTRALEVSLGVSSVDPGSQPPGNDVTEDDTTRCWPIEFVWACPLPAWQVWTYWRGTPNDEDDGLVSVVWTTPAPMASYIATQIDGNGAVGDADPKPVLSLSANPAANKNEQPMGLLVTGPSTVAAVNHVPGLDTSEGWELNLNLPHIIASNQIVTVSPFDDVGGYGEQRP